MPTLDRLTADSLRAPIALDCRPVSASSPRPITAAALGAFIAFTAAVLINQYYRMAMALMAPGLAVDMALTADRLGLLAAAYFLAFSAMQLPVGLLLDRLRHTLPIDA